MSDKDLEALIHAEAHRTQEGALNYYLAERTRRGQRHQSRIILVLTVMATIAAFAQVYLAFIAPPH